MAMLIRVEHSGDKSGREECGWLVLNYQGPNVFHVDDGTKTIEQVQKHYGGLIKLTVRVGKTEYTRLKSNSMTR